MAPLRLRHPKGVSTIQVPLDSDEYTVQDLQQEIHRLTDVLPSLQDLKSGYPPRSLAIIPELPLSSLGLKSGEQIILIAKPDTGARSALSTSSEPQRVSSATIPAASTGTSTSQRTASVSAGPKPSNSSSPDSVETDGGILVHRIVPDDNSCLFSSVALIFEQDINKAAQMRKIVANEIEKDPATYNEAILGYPPSKYIAHILKPSTWGGAIELTVLAKYYRTEIASIDVETGRIDHFSPGEGGGGGTRCLLIYSGIHYDAATLAPMADAPAEWHQTFFPIRSTTDDGRDPILVAAKSLADILRSKRAFTNTATFDLKCEECGQGLKGEKGARKHAEETGHVRFGEY